MSPARRRGGDGPAHRAAAGPETAGQPVLHAWRTLGRPHAHAGESFCRYRYLLPVTWGIVNSKGLLKIQKKGADRFY
jgi:hypothetical protein